MKNNFSEVNGFEIYQRIIYLINHSLYKKQEIIETLGITRQNLAKWKKGSLPSADTLVKISELFNVSTYWLLTGNDTEYQVNVIRSYKSDLLSELEILKQKIESI